MLTNQDINILKEILSQRIEEVEEFGSFDEEYSLLELQELSNKLVNINFDNYIIQDIESQKYVIFNSKFDSTIYTEYEIILTNDMNLATKINNNKNYLKYGNLLSLILKMIKDDTKYKQIFVMN